MVSQVTKVINKEGFHMRPANMFVKEMTAFQSDVHLAASWKCGPTVRTKMRRWPRQSV